MKNIENIDNMSNKVPTKYNLLLKNDMRKFKQSTHLYKKKFS